MKKLLSILLLLFIVTMGCACNEGSVATTPTTAPVSPKEPTPFPLIQSSVFEPGGMAEIINNHVNPSLKNLKSYSYEDLWWGSAPRGVSPRQNFTNYANIVHYNVFFPFECVGMTNDDTMYVVFKVTTESGENFYTYRFFKRTLYVPDDCEIWEPTGNCEVYYLTNSLSHDEFTSAFNIGSDMEDAIEISPGLKFDLDNRYDYSYKYYPQKPEIPTQTCYQLLEDGVLILRFEANCTTDEWEAQGKPDSALICTDMEFYPNGTAATVDGLELTVLTAPASKRPPLPEEPLTPSTPLPTGTTPLSDLTQYDYETYDMYTMQRNLVANTSVHLWSLDGFNSMFPVQRIEPLGNDHLCVIYSFETNEGLSTYVYAIFDRTAYTSAEKPYTGWSYDSEFYFVSRRLSRVNFSSIAVGDSATKVSAIDSSLMFEMRNHMMSETTHIIQAYKLLFDGLLIITLEAPRVDGTTISPAWEDYSVSEMTFYPHNSTDIPYNVSVLGYPDLLQDN